MRIVGTKNAKWKKTQTYFAYRLRYLALIIIKDLYFAPKCKVASNIIKFDEKTYILQTLLPESENEILIFSFREFKDDVLGNMKHCLRDKIKKNSKIDLN